MRRRESSAPGDLPKSLRLFVAADWPGRDEAARYSGWILAREEWKDDRGITVLADDEAAWAAFPDGEFRRSDV